MTTEEVDPMTRPIKLLTALLATLLLLPAAADAREYVVHTCKLPDGRPAPTDGWSAHGVGNYAAFGNGCAAGGALTAKLAGDHQTVGASSIGWNFDSGPALIRGYVINHHGQISGRGEGVTMYMFTADAENSGSGGGGIVSCKFSDGCSTIGGVLARSAAQIAPDSRSWWFTIGCGGYIGFNCLPAGGQPFGRITIDSAQFVLDDPEQPRVEQVGGDLTAPGAVNGTLAVTAADAVSGVARAVIEADGVVVVEARPDDAGCRPLGLAGARADYLARRPCPARWSFTLELPAGKIPPGTRTLRARIFDAAGNATPLLAPRTLARGSVDAQAVVGGRIVLDSASRRRTAYGRQLRLTGRLETLDGNPLPGTAVNVALRSTASTRRLITRQLQTSSGGRFVLELRATASRALTFESPTTGAVQKLALTVSSPIVLRPRRQRVKRLGRMRLTGRVRGERARHGANIAIKVRVGRGWRTIRLARADRLGRFKFTYRFRRTLRGRFVFRAVAPRTDDLTTAPSPSNRISVRVG